MGTVSHYLVRYGESPSDRRGTRPPIVDRRLARAPAWRDGFVDVAAVDFIGPPWTVVAADFSNHAGEPPQPAAVHHLAGYAGGGTEGLRSTRGVEPRRPDARTAWTTVRDDARLDVRSGERHRRRHHVGVAECDRPQCAMVIGNGRHRRHSLETAGPGVSLLPWLPARGFSVAKRRRRHRAARQRHGGHRATPAHAGEVIDVLALGLGRSRVHRRWAARSPSPSCRPSTCRRRPFGGQQAEVRGSWLTAGSTALYNVRMVVPALPPGTATLQINVQGTPSNGARVFVQ